MIEWHYHPYVALVFVTAGISVLVALYAWQQRQAPGAKILVLTMISVAFHSLAVGLDIGAQNVPTMVLARRLEATGLYPLPLLWLIFALQYTGNQAWLRKRRVLWLLLIPTLAIVLEWTSNWHNIIVADVWLNEATTPPTLGWQTGPGYFMYVLYAYLLVIITTVLFVLHRIYAKDVHRKQIDMLLFAITIPGLTMLGYVLKILPPTFPGSPIAFTLSGMLMAGNLYEFRLLDIVPVARALLVEEMRTAVIVLDAQRRLIDINPSARHLCGDEVTILIGMPAEQFLPPPVLEALENDIHEQTEVSLKLDATTTWYNLVISPLYEKDGVIQGWVLSLHNITELRRAQHQAEQAREEAEAANAAKSQFISNVSHELRTPLTNIRLYIDLVKKGTERKRETYLNILERESGRLQELIEDLLYISRLDLDKIELQPKPLDANELLQTLIKDRALLFDEQGLALSFEPATLPLVNVDRKLLERVVTNLLTNALNYTPNGGVVVRTAATAVDGKLWATIAVSDTGLGISIEDQTRLFERFYRGSSSRQAQVPGTGLGLAISQRIAVLHGGYITCESTVGEGSTFTVWLPVQRSVPPSATS